MSTELLAGGHDAATPERVPRVVPWVRRHRLWLIGAVVMVVAALAADQWQQQRELDRLTTAIAAGESQIRTTDEYFDGMVAYYSPVIFRAAPPPGLRDSFQVAVGEGAQEGIASMASAAEDLDGITILPWHQHVLAARATYHERIVLWQGFLAQASTDAEALFNPAPGFADSAASTRTALRLALPWSADAVARERIENALPETP